jgi:hypothetical protein
MPSTSHTIAVQRLCRAERLRAQQVFDRARARDFADHPDSAEDPSDDVPFERSFEDDALDTAPTLQATRQ